MLQHDNPKENTPKFVLSMLEAACNITRYAKESELEGCYRAFL